MPIQTFDKGADSTEHPQKKWPRKTQICAEIAFVKKMNTERMWLSFIRHFPNRLPTCSQHQHLSGS